MTRRLWSWKRRADYEEPPASREEAPRIRLIESGSGGAVISDSQSGELHRVFEREGVRQIDAVPVARRLLGREITARTVAIVEPPEAPPEAEDVMLGFHFVLDERTRHVYRVSLTPRRCLAERLWGQGLREIEERPLGGALFWWDDLDDDLARSALRGVCALVPEAPEWGLRFVSLQGEAGSDVQRRLYSCPLGHVRHHSRPSRIASRPGTEGAIEIPWQKRILLTFEPAPPASRRGTSSYTPQRPAPKVTSEVGELPF